MISDHWVTRLFIQQFVQANTHENIKGSYHWRFENGNQLTQVDYPQRAHIMRKAFPRHNDPITSYLFPTFAAIIAWRRTCFQGSKYSIHDVVCKDNHNKHAANRYSSPVGRHNSNDVTNTAALVAWVFAGGNDQPTVDQHLNGTANA